MTFEFEYLSEFEFVFKNILDYETGSIDEKKTGVENLVQVSVKLY